MNYCLNVVFYTIEPRTPGCAMWFIYWGPSGMVAGEAIIISITGGFLFGLLTASFHWWRRKVNRLPPWDDV
ncbi:hypothetical protein CD42_005030 [Escherichia coli]|nr:hypothetical protein [Escherichia coli]